MSLAKVFCALMAMGLVVACESPGRNYTDTKLVETLEIEIMPNTSKMFVYRLRLPEEHMNNGVRIERGGFSSGGGERSGIAISSSTPKRLLENTGFVVQKMGYCRDGFLEIDSSVAPYNLWVKGECKEGATDDDIKKFGTKQTLPVTLAK